jgi:hypothetical protein
VNQFPGAIGRKPGRATGAVDAASVALAVIAFGAGSRHIVEDVFPDFQERKVELTVGAYYIPYKCWG